MLINLFIIFFLPSSGLSCASPGLHAVHFGDHRYKQLLLTLLWRVPQLVERKQNRVIFGHRKMQGRDIVG